MRTDSRLNLRKSQQIHPRRVTSAHAADSILNTTLILAMLLLAVASPARANEFADAWQQPLSLEFPQPARQVVLSHIIDPQQWIDAHRLDAQILPFGRHQHLVQFSMDDADWQSSALCNDPGVSICETVTCQGIQRADTVSGTVHNHNNSKARIIRRAPSQVTRTEAEATSCRVPVGLVPPDPAAAGSGANINLNIARFGQRNDIRPNAAAASVGQPSSTTPSGAAGLTEVEGNAVSNSAAAAKTAPGTVANTQSNTASKAAQSARAKIIDLFDGSAQLATSHLPADSSEYELLVGQQCNEISVPLDSVAPAHEPQRMTALVDAGSAAAIALSYGLQVIEESVLGASGETLAVFSTNAPLPQALGLLAMDTRVTAVQREYIYRTTAGTNYTDPFARFVYGPDKLGAVALHGSASGQGQTVAVIDTGVMLDHPELQGRIAHADFTGDGFSNDAHGTAVAGIIAAAANNALGIYGVAPQTQILALKACQPTGDSAMAAKCRTSALVKALDWAMQQDARLINMSLAGPPDELLAKYVALAVSQDRLVIAGAGNSGPLAKPAFPAALPGVLAVTAIDRQDQHYRQANIGGYIDVAAPGVDIVTPAPDGNYPVSSGTSWAAAHITGVAALLKDLLPLASAAEISAIITTATRDLGEPGKDPLFGHGLVDACQAAASATADPEICPAPTEEDGRAFN